MASIPAAGLSQARIELIGRRHPMIASEISELNKRITYGNSTNDDIKRFIRLLHNIGEAEESEDISRASIQVKGDEFYALYTELFGRAAEITFANAIEDFQTRFDIRLLNPVQIGFLRTKYGAKIPGNSKLRQFGAIISEKMYTATFAYGTPGRVGVDLQADDEPYAMPLDWNGADWAIPDWFQNLKTGRL
jgi:hypothetical protein